jgi:hypothetical protein
LAPPPSIVPTLLSLPAVPSLSGRLH